MQSFILELCDLDYHIITDSNLEAKFQQGKACSTIRDAYYHPCITIDNSK